MILIGIFLLIGILLFLGNKAQKKYYYNTLTLIILIMAIIQAPLFYYYTSGMLAIFQLIPYLAIGVGLSIYLLSPFYKKSDQVKTKFHKFGLITAITLGLISLLFGSSIVEKLDWVMRRKTRDTIVTNIKNEIQNRKTLNSYNIEKWNFPPISNGRKEIDISKGEKGELTIIFYIDQGFIDHFSAFVYTNDSNELKGFYTFGASVKQLDCNWYRVSQ